MNRSSAGASRARQGEPCGPPDFEYLARSGPAGRLCGCRPVRAQAVVLHDLRVPPANRLEKLRGDRDGQHSIRINDQYRICFTWTEAGATGVEITDYH
jgi:toxin HigB-1